MLPGAPEGALPPSGALLSGSPWTHREISTVGPALWDQHCRTSTVGLERQAQAELDEPLVERSGPGLIRLRHNGALGIDKRR